MPYNPSPKVAAARHIGEKFKKQQVVVLMIDLESGTLEYASWGETKPLCDDARRLADAPTAACRAASQSAARVHIESASARQSVAAAELESEMMEIELQILQAIQQYKYQEMPIREIPFGVDANFSYCEIQMKAIDLAQQGYLCERQMFFSLTDKGREALAASRKPDFP